MDRSVKKTRSIIFVWSLITLLVPIACFLILLPITSRQARLVEEKGGDIQMEGLGYLWLLLIVYEPFILVFTLISYSLKTIAAYSWLTRAGTIAVIVLAVIPGTIVSLFFVYALIAQVMSLPLVR